MVQKRVLAIHDISCLGKCSLTVALPIISSVGLECTVIPTAVLSTHTGGFQNYRYHSLTKDMEQIVNHWVTLNLKFDLIYVGFLGSFLQIDIICDIIDKFGENTVVVIDPCMASNGKLYPTFNREFPKQIKKLCAKADIIIPNMTEAIMLLGEKYVSGPYTVEFIDTIMNKLTNIGPKKIVLTGVYFDNKRIGSSVYDVSIDEKSTYLCNKIPGSYYGAGDIFGSTMVASILSGLSLSDANRVAVNYTAESIKRTYDARTDTRFGINFEEGLQTLVKNIKNCYTPRA
ncbi:MAG: pyridoxamine kinase [archaeon]|nr:pyridoxamine kinase [archaeon]